MDVVVRAATKALTCMCRAVPAAQNELQGHVCVNVDTSMIQPQEFLQPMWP